VSKKATLKPRKEAIYATTVGEASSIGITIDTRTGAIRFDGAVENVYSQRSYERTKGPKILSRIHQHSEFVSFEGASTIFDNFDMVAAVDTNTNQVGDRRISVVAVVPIEPLWINEKHELKRAFKIRNPFCLEYLNLRSEKPENFGWMAAHELMVHRQTIQPSSRLCMIVDSDLGNIPEYNLRKRPVSETTFLPPNTQLAYASSDVGSESFINRAIRIADSISKQVFSKLADGTLPPNAKTVKSEWFDGYRFITGISDGNNDDW
jgi:hypothetical protein